MNRCWEGSLILRSAGPALLVHLPIDVDVLTSLCLSTLAKMRQTLSSLPSCNSSSVEEALHSISTSHPDLGSVEMGASARESGTGCIVDYWVTITEL